MNCELCKTPSPDIDQSDLTLRRLPPTNMLMDFNCLMPSLDQMLQAFICGDCWSSHEDDMAVAISIIKSRALERNLPLPLSIEQLSALLDIREEPTPES